MDALWTANSIFVATYALLIWERLPKVVVAMLGAVAVIITGVMTQAEAFAAVDWNVIFLLVGMMILINILKETGAMTWLAVQAARRSRGSGVLLMLFLALITALLSALLDNVTTILVMVSVTCTLARELGLNPVPYLLAEVMASNIGGTATLIGDPPNIMIGSAAGLTFNDFLLSLTPPVSLILPLSLGLLYALFRRSLVWPDEVKVRVQALSVEGLITDPKLLIKALTIFGLVLLGFVTHHITHIELATIALAGAGLLLIFENRDEIWNDIEWTTIFFFVGLFIIIGAVEKVGTLELLSSQFVALAQGSTSRAEQILLWGSGLLSGVIDNIPYTATMIPVIKGMSSTLGDVRPLWWALSLGACLGGNLTLIGATANVIAVEAAQREGFPISFWGFLKVGSLITLLSLGVSSLYLALS